MSLNERKDKTGTIKEIDLHLSDDEQKVRPAQLPRKHATTPAARPFVSPPLLLASTPHAPWRAPYTHADGGDCDDALAPIC